MAGLESLFSLVNGIGQSIRGHGMHPDRPDYEIPQETQQQLALRQNLLNAGMPGEQQARQDIYTNQANSLAALSRGAGDQGQFLAGLGAAQGTTNNALNRLQTQRQQSYFTSLAGLERAQDNMANARDTQFQLNKLNPYYAAMQEKNQLINSGNQNIASGLRGIDQGVQAALGMGALGGGASAAASTPLQSLGAGPIGGIGTQSPFSSLGAATLAPMGSAVAGGSAAGGGIASLVSALGPMLI